jgi:hypothetical protein
MANVNNPRGFAPLHGNEGGPPPINYYLCNTSTDIFRGDMVEMQATGLVRTIAATAGTTKIVGVAAHHIVAAASASAQQLAVYDDPDQVFMAQDDGSATPLQSQVGDTAQIVITTGNTTTRQSAQAVKLSTAGQTATDPLILRGNVTYPNVDNTLIYAMWMVQLNLHLFSKGNAGI